MAELPPNVIRFPRPYRRSPAVRRSLVQVVPSKKKSRLLPEQEAVVQDFLAWCASGRAES